jgi:hypothetical protein
VNDAAFKNPLRELLAIGVLSISRTAETSLNVTQNSITGGLPGQMAAHASQRNRKCMSRVWQQANGANAKKMASQAPGDVFSALTASSSGKGGTE